MKTIEAIKEDIRILFQNEFDKTKNMISICETCEEITNELNNLINRYSMLYYNEGVHVTNNKRVLYS